MIVDDRRLAPANNNLTLLRLILASAVIWTHSVWRMTGIEGVDEIEPLLGVPISAIAVDGFFFLSGFLVYSSLLRRANWREFLLARLARLWPALAMSVLCTVAVGWFITRAPGLSYFTGPTAKFILGNLSLVAGKYNLTGIYCGGSLCNVNGSLWTITWEARCYLALALLSVAGLASPRLMKLLILPGTLMCAIAIHVPAIEAALRSALGNGIFYNLMMLDRLWVMFAAGIAAYVWRDRLVLSWWTTAALLVALVISDRLYPLPHLSGLLTTSLVLNIGFLTAARGAISGTWPDYSYGMYIYAFPVMMAAEALIPMRSHAVLAMVDVALTFPLAAISWHFVEKPVLDMVRSRRGRKAPSSPVIEGQTGAASI